MTRLLERHHVEIEKSATSKEIFYQPPFTYQQKVNKESTKIHKSNYFSDVTIGQNIVHSESHNFTVHFIDVVSMGWVARFGSDSILPLGSNFYLIG